jgi:hypothetical protein
VQPPWKNFSEKISKGDQGKIYPPLDFLRNLGENLKGGTKGYFDLSREKPSRGDQRKFFVLNSEMFLKNISFGPPFEISIEFRQKSLKIYDFC